MSINVKPQHYIKKHTNDCGGGYAVPKEITNMIDQFKEGISKLHGKLLKKKYRYIKETLLSLNNSLDKYDTKNKNQFDESNYNKLTDLDQCYYLVEDIFDNYRLQGTDAVYSSQETEEIHKCLKSLKIIVNMKWYDELFYSLGIV